MVKDITKSQLDFLALEEVSDQAAETISGGGPVLTTLSPAFEVETDLLDPIDGNQALIDLLHSFIELGEKGKEMAGIEVPSVGEFLPELPEVKSLAAKLPM